MQMLKQLRRILEDCIRERRGNVAILFGFALVPLLLGTGVAVDYGRALLVRERMAGAADAAALAIGSWPGLTQAEQTDKAQQFFDANYPPSTLGTVGKLNVSVSDSDTTVTVSGQVKTTFMNVANIDHIDVGASSTVTIGMGTVEVALVLDNSGSMLGSKIASLKTAASNLVDTLFKSAQNSSLPDPIKIAVVPFAASVNVGTQYATASWMDTGATGTYHADTMKAYGAPSTTNNFTLFSSLTDSSGKSIAWGGCVEARPSPDDITDNSSVPFVPMFAPDEPDNWTATTSACSNGTSGSSSYTGSGSSLRYNCAPTGVKSYNNYLPDAGTTTTCAGSSNVNWTCSSGSANCGGTNTGMSEKNAFGGVSLPARKLCKYGTTSNKATVQSITVGGIPGGPNFMCTSAPVMPLSTDKSSIEAAINAMVAQGATGVGEGAMWGWRVLSPGLPFTEGRAYGTKNNQKFLVLMTDGANTYYPNSTFLKSWYDLYGYVVSGHLGTTSTSSSTLTQAMDQRTVQACANIKNAPGGITIYTVGYDISALPASDAAAALSVLQQCASSPDKYYAPNSDSDLLAAFSGIGQDISQLRISK